jgi:hypothetical protein
LAFVITLMAKNAFQGEVKILTDRLRIYHITLVIFFRPNRGRRSGSPFTLTLNDRRFYQSFHFAAAGMTFITTAFTDNSFVFQLSYLGNLCPLFVAPIATIPGKGLFPIMTSKAVFLRIVIQKGYIVRAFLNSKELQMAITAVQRR